MIGILLGRWFRGQNTCNWSVLENRDIIVMSGDWNRMNPGCVQRVTVPLARRNRVVWVSGVPIRAPRARIRDFQRIMDKGFKMLMSTTNSRNTSIPVTEIHPFFVPFYDNPVFRRFNDRLLRSSVLKKIQELRFKNYLVIPTNPMVAGVIHTLAESSSHYICTDDYAANVGAFKCLGRLEHDLLQKVDSCFSTSHVLMNMKIPRSGENHFISQGVDIDHFKVTGAPPPDALAHLRRPIVGYYGLLESWVDYELIVRCAVAYPRVSFVVIGEAKTDVSMLRRQSNIILLDHVPYENLPRYAEMFDVGLIPRRINRLTVAMNPIKLLEYLALELPVVSTNLPEVKRFGDLAFVAESHEEFVQLIGEALKDNSPARRRLRRAEAERFSWDSVADGVSEVMREIDERKSRERNLSISSEADAS